MGKLTHSCVARTASSTSARVPRPVVSARTISSTLGERSAQLAGQAGGLGRGDAAAVERAAAGAQHVCAEGQVGAGVGQGGRDGVGDREVGAPRACKMESRKVHRCDSSVSSKSSVASSAPSIFMGSSSTLHNYTMISCQAASSFRESTTARGSYQSRTLPMSIKDRLQEYF